MGPSGSQVCGHNLDIIFQACEELGIPLAMEKLEGLTTRLVFLGIEIDTTSGLMRLPEKKLARLHQALQSWAGHKACTRWVFLTMHVVSFTLGLWWVFLTMHVVSFALGHHSCGE